MNYRECRDVPVIHWTAWPETFEKWKTQGYPEDQVNEHEFFDAVPAFAFLLWEAGIFPAFDEKVIEETDDYRIFTDGAGVRHKDWKNKSCIPQHLGFTFQTAEQWPMFKERLQPDPGRLKNIDDAIIYCRDTNHPVAFWTASMMGWIRDWMGVENMSFLMYDSPDVYEDIVNTIADLVCWAADIVLPRARELECPVEMGFGWEDICGKTGPLVSPHIFDQYVAQGYRRIRDKLEAYDIHLYGLDSDGFVEPLIPHWMEAGVNVMFPIEPGTWKATPEDIRQKFGKELRIIGGFDKLVLEKDKAAIDAELESHMDLMREGGYIMMPDHLITPGVPLANYQYYLEKVRALTL